MNNNRFLYNRIANSSNRFQGEYKRVLCVCSAGLLRSPTTAVVLSQKPYNFNTRAAGLVADFALVPVDEVLISWADEIVCMTEDQEAKLKELVAKHASHKKVNVICLNIEDSFAYRDPKLIKAIKKNYDAAQETLNEKTEQKSS